MKKKIVIILTLILLFGSVSASAPDAKTVTGTVSDARFTLNGKEVVLKNRGNNKELRAVIIDDVPYVPIFSIADLVKMPMTYNAANNIYQIGLRSGLGDNVVDLKETSNNDIKYFVKTIDSDMLTINKQSFESGLVLQQPAKEKTYSRTFELNGEYSELNFKSLISSVTSKKENLIITFVDVEKKRVIKTIYAGADKTLVEYTVKVSGVTKLQISVESGDKTINKYIMGDIFLK